MSRKTEIPSLEATMDDKGLPVRRTDLTHHLDIAAGWSDEVLVKIVGFRGLHVGRYAYGSKQWRVEWLHGKVEVIEWWPLPKEGTGVKVEV